jgi:cardiolipin synthase A/B
MIWAAIILTFHALGIVSSIHNVMHTRTSQGTIAWLFSLNTIPELAVPLYWIFGHNRFQGYVTAHKVAGERPKKFFKDLAKHLAPFGIDPSEMKDATHAAERLADFPFLRGNAVELLVDGEATFESILAGIDAADEYILFQFFIVHDDELGRKVQTHLIDALKRGVHVYFLYDEIGSHKLPQRYCDELQQAGAEVYAFHTRKGPRNRFQVNFRNHRKVVVVDGHTCWIGGHNVGDEYLGKNPKFGHWRDTHIKLDGPATIGAQLSFITDWNWAAGAVPELNWKPTPATHDDVPVLMIPSGPADNLETAALMFLQAINSATRRIWIASPYFVPDETMISALQLAGLRGIDVRILIPDKPDHWLVYLAAFSYFADASKTGVKFYRYKDGFLHQKVLLFDDRAACVGTANFDNRSFRLNFEITAVVVDDTFVKEIETMLLNDFEHAVPVEADEYAKQPFWFRLAVRIARLTSPIQ